MANYKQLKEQYIQKRNAFQRGLIPNSPSGKKLASWFGVLGMAFLSLITLWQLNLASADCSSPLTPPLTNGCVPVTSPITLPVPQPSIVPSPAPLPVEVNYAIFAGDQTVAHLKTWTPNKNYRIDLSIRPDMSWDVYLDFIYGKPDQYGLIKTTNPQRWDKYQCGKTLYWRVLTEDRSFKGPIQTTTVNCSQFINLNPPVGGGLPNAYGFLQVELKSYNYNTNSGKYWITGSLNGLVRNTRYSLWICGQNLSGTCFGASNNSIITDANGWASVGQEVYANNPINNQITSIRLVQPFSSSANVCYNLATPCLLGSYRSPVAPISNFTNLSANLTANVATFNYYYSEFIDTVHIDLSTRSDMSWDVYLDFTGGMTESLTEYNPGKWDKYECDKVLYWRAWNANRTKSSSIQTVKINCNGASIVRPSNNQPSQTINTQTNPAKPSARVVPSATFAPAKSAPVSLNLNSPVPVPVSTTSGVLSVSNTTSFVAQPGNAVVRLIVQVYHVVAQAPRTVFEFTANVLSAFNPLRLFRPRS